MRRRRRPLMRGAMVAGAGYAAGNARAKGKAQDAEQEQRIADLEAQQAAPAPPPAAAPAPPPAGGLSDESMNQLVKLKELLDSGVLTQEEFDKEKQRLLGG
jgi:hypothetical protein